MVTKKKVAKRNKKRHASPGLLVSERVQIKDVRLISCECEQKPTATAGKKGYDIDVSTDVQLNEDQRVIVVLAKFWFVASIEKKSSEPVLTIDALYALAYQVDSFDGLTQEGFEQFANLNGVYNAWPYWREFVQNTVGRMGLPPLTIPVFRIFEPSTKPTGTKKKSKKRKKKVD